MISNELKRANPNCAATCATLRLYGDALDPAEVSRLLGLEPTDSAAKGETVVVGAKSRTAPTGRWILTSENAIQSTNLEDHLDWLLDRLSVVPCDVPGVGRADVFCYWVSATGHGGPELSPQMLARLASLQLTLGFDLYFPSR